MHKVTGREGIKSLEYKLDFISAFLFLPVTLSAGVLACCVIIMIQRPEHTFLMLTVIVMCFLLCVSCIMYGTNRDKKLQKLEEAVN